MNIQKRYRCPECGGSQFKAETEKYHLVTFDGYMNVVKDEYMPCDYTDGHWLTCISCSHAACRNEFEVEDIGYIILADDDEMKRYALKGIIEELLPNVGILECECNRDVAAALSEERHKRYKKDSSNPLVAVVTDNYMPLYMGEKLQACADDIGSYVKASKLNVPVITVSRDVVQTNNTYVILYDDKEEVREKMEEIFSETGLI